MTARELGAKLRSGETSCVALVNSALAAIKQRANLRAFITVTETQALAEAEERDRELRNGIDRGPLHGIPIALKDLIYTRGIRTTGGSLLFTDFVPDRDAPVVERLRAAGAISIGKTNLHELAFGITSRNPHFGPVLNPLDETRLPGGSSGGSAAAIAAEMVPIALGTDTGGSIRIPASYCGVVGLKPTYGRVSRTGVLPLAFSLDHVGPLGASVEDCALAMNALADSGVDFNLPPLTDWKTVRVGLPRNFFFDRVEQEVADQVRKAVAVMEAAGAQIVEVTLPELAESNAASRVVQFAEVGAIYNKQYDRALFGADLWSLLEQSRMVAAHEYVNAQRLRTIFRASMDEIWKRIDVLAAPTTPITAPKVELDTIELGGETESVRMATTRLVRSINYFGEPALSLPCGRSETGLPIGLQLISKPFSEPRLLQVAAALERML